MDPITSSLSANNFTNKDQIIIPELLPEIANVILVFLSTRALKCLREVNHVCNRVVLSRYLLGDLNSGNLYVFKRGNCNNRLNPILSKVLIENFSEKIRCLSFHTLGTHTINFCLDLCKNVEKLNIIDIIVSKVLQNSSSHKKFIQIKTSALLEILVKKINANNLKSLTLLDESIDSAVVQSISEHFADKVLNQLVLGVASVDSEGIRHLSRLTNLTFLELNGGLIDSEAIKSLKPLKKLSSFVFNNVNIDEDAINAIENLSLTTLKLESHDLSFDKCQGLGKCTNLTSLTISRKEKTPLRSIVLNGYWISNLAKLTSLCLTGISIDSVVEESIKRLKNLESLTLQDCG